MGRKHVIYDYRAIVDGDMSQASITGDVTTVGQLDVVTYNVEWSGAQATNGNLTIEFSNDKGATWKTLSFGSVPALDTAADHHELIIQAVGFDLLRPVYTRTNVSASGTLNVRVFGTTKGA